MLTAHKMFCGRGLSSVLRPPRKIYYSTHTNLKETSLCFLQQLKIISRHSSSYASTPLLRGRRAVGWWLLGCSGMVFGAVSIGGLTRLTESGLSIVEWQLIKGMKPPLNEEDWRTEFAKYQQYPEYQYKAIHEMTLDEFKYIFYMEWLHRMWGRAIGLAFFLPAGWFWYRGYFNKPLKTRVSAAGCLLLFQGLLGWYMVKSGLDPSTNSDSRVPRVSQYRLAAHLTSAFVLYMILLRSGLTHILPSYDHAPVQGAKRLRILAHSSKGLLLTTGIIGAFVAGLDAGLTYNSWPKYADRWIPTDLWTRQPLWRNFTENPSMVQFLHRNFAYTSLLAMTATWLAGRRLPLSPRAKLALHTFVAVAYLQVSLGIATLVYHVPVWLASLHQNGFMMLITATVWLTTEIRRFPIK